MNAPRRVKPAFRQILIGTEVTLNVAEQKLAQWIGKMRYLNNQKNGIAHDQIGTLDRDQIDLIGAAGELAFCKIANVYPPMATILEKPDPGDCILCNKKVDVKTTTREDGHLVSNLASKEDPMDLYVLMTGTFPTYTFRGATTELLSHVKDLGHGDCYAMDQSQLVSLYI